MSWDDINAYYNPEKLDLTPVAEVDYSSGNYEFDTRVVWKHKDGKFYTARDAGCSCPVPFEGYSSLEKLDELDFDLLKAEVDKETDKGGEDGNWGYYLHPAAASHFLNTVRNATREITV